MPNTFPTGVGYNWPAVLGLFAVLAAFAYLCGCFNGAVIVSKYILRDDVRGHGSGNAGLTNFHRVFGGKLTAVVLLLDVVKMVVAVTVSAGVTAWLFGGSGWLSVLWGVDLAGSVPDMGWWVLFAKYWAGAFCVIGHMYPCMFGFKGGKGVLSGGALILMMDWRIALIGWGGFLLLAVLTRWVSLGSVWAGASFPVTTFFVYRDPVLVVLALVSGGLLVWKHRGNIQRILNGTESKFSLHKKKE